MISGYHARGTRLFFTEMRKRIAKGAETYGDFGHEERSWDDSIRMMEEELYDTANYAYFLWLGIQDMKLSKIKEAFDVRNRNHIKKTE